MANPKPVNNQKAARGANRRSGNVKKSAAEQRAELAKQLGLTRKQIAFVDTLLSNTSLSATEAYMQIYGNSSRKAASVNSARTLAKASVAIYADSAVKSAKERIVSLVKSDNESIALKASQDIVDRTEGKAVQKNETINKTIEVKLDLGSLRVGSHYIQAPQQAPAIEK